MMIQFLKIKLFRKCISIKIMCKLSNTQYFTFPIPRFNYKMAKSIYGMCGYAIVCIYISCLRKKIKNSKLLPSTIAKVWITPLNYWFILPPPNYALWFKLPLTQFIFFISPCKCGVLS